MSVIEAPVHLRVAEALGWRAWLETRGTYTLAVCSEKDGKEPWKNSRYQHPELYRKVPLAIAFTTGFFGSRWPDYDTDWSATGPLIEKYGFRLDKMGLFGWTADSFPDARGYRGNGKTPLLAVCNLILALKEAGKL